jgi:hypothetical protein|tara:strand:- start:3536 stop:3709 length:174 start_codon:yes stop_codon:yes gene_type:complete
MKRKGVKGKKKMMRITVRQKHVMEMLLNRKDGAHHNRSKDVKAGKSRKAKHKGKREW